MDPKNSPLAPGDILDGRYRIDRLLGSGGMAFVYRATHVKLGTLVAIKVVSPPLSVLPATSERFMREAKAVTQLRGENVVRVFDVSTTADGLPYMAMEYLAGHDLELREALPVADAVEYVLQACKAVAEAHHLGIVHRDLKPANLFLTTGADGLPCVKLIDFGISRADELAAPRLTNPGVVMGSLGYMPPEQMAGEPNVGALADIWGLGAVLYELLTGKPAYTGDSLCKIYTESLLRPPPAPSSVRSEIPEGLDEVVLRCLRPLPADRFPNVAELAAALVPFGGERAVEHAEAAARFLDVPVRSEPKCTPMLEPASEENWEQSLLLPELTAQRSNGAPLIATAVLLSVGIFLVAMLRGRLPIAEVAPAAARVTATAHAPVAIEWPERPLEPEPGPEKSAPIATDVRGPINRPGATNVAIDPAPPPVSVAQPIAARELLAPPVVEADSATEPTAEAPTEPPDDLEPVP